VVVVYFPADVGVRILFLALDLENVFDILTLVELSQQLVLWLVLQGHQRVGREWLVPQVETVARWVPRW